MAEKKHIQHLKSDALSGGTAKLPQASDLLYGEIAINYKKGYETISMKNDENEIVTFNPNKITIDSSLSTTSENPVQNKVITDALDDKQDELVSGTNIKTINGTSLLGSGDITIGGGVTVDSALSDTSVNPVQNKVITSALAFKKVTNSSDTSKVGLVNGLSESYDTNIGKGAVIEGDGTSSTKITASGAYSHAEGNGTTASGDYSHVEGYYTKANDSYSHAEGLSTTASGNSSHAEGGSTTASGYSSHAEGGSTTASGDSSHAEGNSTTASGLSSHTEGLNTIANNQSEHASGQYNVSSKASATFGNSGNTLFSVGNGTTVNNRHNAFEIRQNGDIYITKNNTDIKLQDALGGGGVTVDSALSTTSENPVQNKVITNALAFKKVTNPSDSSKVGIVNNLTQYYDTNIGEGAVIEGGGEEENDIQASGNYSHAEGYGTQANGYASHAEGDSTTASGYYSHAEGDNTRASGNSSHAEGYNTTASGDYSHAEGYNTIASDYYSHAEGYMTTASRSDSHAEGFNTTANGSASHAEGYRTITNNQSEHACGQYNVSSSASTTFGNSGNTLFSVGNGKNLTNRHNAFEIRQNGDIYIVKDNTDVKLQEVLNDLESGKVDKVTGKGLSTNDFDDEYMEALDHINIDSNNTLEINNDSSNDIKLSTDGYIFIGDNYTNKVNIDAGSGPVNISSYQDNIELTARYNGSIKFTVEYGSDAIVLSVGGTELTLNQANLQKLINLLQNS